MTKNRVGEMIASDINSRDDPRIRKYLKRTKVALDYDYATQVKRTLSLESTPIEIGAGF